MRAGLSGNPGGYQRGHLSSGSGSFKSHMFVKTFVLNLITVRNEPRLEAESKKDVLRGLVL